MKSSGWLVLVLSVILGLVMAGMATAAGDFSVGDYTLVTSKRVSLYEYDYTYKASLTNNGLAVSGVKANVVSASPYIKVMEDELDFGDVASGATVKSIDTAVLRHDRRGPFDTTKLTWTVTATPATVVVPDVTGQTEEAARSVLQTSGLEVGNVATTYSDSVAVGMVVSQVPTAGSSVAPGTTVELVVSLGPELVSVPDVVGMNQAEATAALLAAGCILGAVDTTASDTVPAGQVISQNPSAGASTTPGSAVSLVLSSGPAPEPTEATIPDVTGLTQTAAEEVLKAKGYQLGSVITVNSSTAIVGNVISQDPAAGVAADEGTAVAVVISLGPALASETVPELVGLSQSEAQSAISAAGFAVGTLGHDYSSSVPTGHIVSQNPLPRAKAVSGSGVALIVSLGLLSTPPVPPDPADVAPPLDTTIAPTVAASTAFLYSGSNPIQTGVPEGTIEIKRAAVLRGRVLDRDNQPLSGVNITIKDHPEFGQTFSRADGMFDLAVNGGGYLSINYQKEGFLPAQRQINVPWNDFAIVEDVVLITLDPAVTTVDLAGGAAIQVARGSQVSDDSGARQGTLLVPQGTHAAMTLPDGTSQPLSTLNIRITEYTIGDNGPQAMPGLLPPTSGYTYAMELSADEALAAGASTVTFTEPLYYYVENFIGIPVGTQVPVGYYDAQKTAWVPSADGRVIKIIGINTGLAELDVTGAGTAANASDLANLGVTDTERQQLATLYSVGQTFWRVPISHFTPCDYNYPIKLPTKWINPDNPPIENPIDDDQNQECGSIIGCENQTLGEVVSISGTPFSLHYQSERTAGYLNNRTLDIPLTGAVLPEYIKQINLSVKIAGKDSVWSFVPAPNLHQEFTWDGTDIYGRRLENSQASVNISYIFDGYYQNPSGSSSTFGLTGTSFSTPIRARQDIGIKQEYSVVLGVSPEAKLGLWNLDIHHYYDPTSKILYRGDGGRLSSQTVVDNIITTVAGNGNLNFSGDGGPATAAALAYPWSVAVAPDGSLFIADYGNHRIRRVGPDGIITTVAGTGEYGFSGDGGPATAAALAYPWSVAVAPDGSLFIADVDNERIRRVGPDGIITTVAGTGEYGFSGDGGPAISASLKDPSSVAMAPDGSLYFSDTRNNRIRRVGPDGIITTVAGNGEYGFSGDGGPATAAALAYPWSVAVAPDGSLFIADESNERIRRVSPDGIITTVAGSGECGFSGDGGQAVDANLCMPNSVAVGWDGSLYIADSGNHRIRRVGPDGIITTIAGNGIRDFSGDSGPATAASLYTPPSIAISPDGSVYIADAYNQRIRRLSGIISDAQLYGFLIPSSDATQVYHFDNTGKHLRTLNALTGTPIYQFGYDSDGRLFSVTDGDGQVTTVERDGLGNPTAIIAPHGQRTTLGRDGNGYLERITNPAGESYSMSYTSEGLMYSFSDPKGNTSTFSYDNLGLLFKDENAAGGFKTLLSTDVEGVKYNSLFYTDLRLRTIYTTENLSTGDLERTITYPFGGVQTKTINTNGTTTITEPDGTVITTTEGPDPRFDMMAPVQKDHTVKTPGGLTFSMQQTRTATLAIADNPLSLTSQTETITINHHIFKTAFDAISKKFTLTSPANRVSEMTIDSSARPLTLLPDPAVLPIRLAYGDQGQLSEVSQGSREVRFSYDSLGRLNNIINPLGSSTYFEYDAGARVNKLTLPSNHSYHFSYDFNGNRTGITMPNGAVHSLGYNNLNLLSSYTPPGNLPYFWEYSLDKELLKETLPGGREITYGYDNGGRSSGLSYPEATITRKYEGATTRVNEIVRSPSDDGTGQTIAFAYDGALVMSRAFSGVANGTFNYNYDNNFLLTNMTLQSGSETVSLPISYDADGLVTKIGSFTFTRNAPFGRTTKVTDGTMQETIDYDAYGRVQHRDYSVNGRIIYSVGFTYDAAGQIIARDENLNDSSIINEYFYDVDGQLIQVKKEGGIEEEYEYDDNGNRTSYRSGNALDVTAVYDEQDRLENLGSIEYQFDADGFLVKKGQVLYTYSSKGELLSANLEGVVITYNYDGMNRRVARTDPTGTTQYLYGDLENPFLLTASRSPDNVLTIYNYDMEDRLISFERGGTKYYVACDQVGSPRIITDDSGEKIKFIEYHSFGNVIYDSDPSFDLPIGFAGGLKDSITGLIRFGLRDYDPWAGRWGAKDPILFDSGVANLYRYVENNPISHLDPFGLCKKKGEASWECASRVAESVLGEELDIIDSLGFWGIGTMVLSGTVGSSIFAKMADKAASNTIKELYSSASQVPGHIGLKWAAVYKNVKLTARITSLKAQLGMLSKATGILGVAATGSSLTMRLLGYYFGDCSDECANCGN